MVTLTSLLALYSLPPALTTACTSEVLAILMRVDTNPPELGVSSNEAARGFGLFGTMMLTDSARTRRPATRSRLTYHFRDVVSRDFVAGLLVLAVSGLHRVLEKRLDRHGPVLLLRSDLYLRHYEFLATLQTELPARLAPAAILVVPLKVFAARPKAAFGAEKYDDVMNTLYNSTTTLSISWSATARHESTLPRQSGVARADL